MLFLGDEFTKKFVPWRNKNINSYFLFRWTMLLPSLRSTVGWSTVLTSSPSWCRSKLRRYIYYIKIQMIKRTLVNFQFFATKCVFLGGGGGGGWSSMVLFLMFYHIPFISNLGNSDFKKNRPSLKKGNLKGGKICRGQLSSIFKKT